MVFVPSRRQAREEGGGGKEEEQRKTWREKDECYDSHVMAVSAQMRRSLFHKIRQNTIRIL